MKKEIEKIADKLVYAYKKKKLINPIPIKFTKNIENATKLRKLCESKINTKIVGFSACPVAAACRNSQIRKS